jgi:Tn7-like transposition protein D/TniQ
MIGYFPTLYPDELIYSACARFQDRAMPHHGKTTLQDLFGVTTASAIIDLPCRLKDFTLSLPPGHGYTVERLINDYTLLPIFSPFLPSERVRQLKADMQDRKGLAIQKRAGIMASRIHLPDRLRFCPLCVVDDEQRFEETYWHRLHQISGVIVCPTHSVFLEDSNAAVRHLSNPFQFFSAEQSVRPSMARGLDPSDNNHTTFLKIARDAEWLLNQRDLVCHPKILRNRYLLLLIERGLATYSGCIRASELLESFKTRYSPALLKRLHCEFSGRDQEKDNWLLRLVRNPKNAQHPIHHLLLMDFLGITAERFFKLPEEIKFFGDAPWPCLNPASDHYRELRVTDLQISYRGENGRPVGTFSCKCGFTYARTGPDQGPEDRFFISKMKSFGSVWGKELKRLWHDPSLSVSEIARRLEVDPLTVRRYAVRLQLSFLRARGKLTGLSPQLQLKPPNTEAAFRTKRRENRMKWSLAIKQNPKMMMKRLRQKLPRVYAWLLKHDALWLKAHKPPPHKRTKAPSGVDWKRRDAILAVRVRSVASSLKSAKGRPVHVTKTAIGRMLGQTALLQQKIDKLPLTAQVLNCVIETPETFAVRRVNWAARCFLHKGVVPKRWQLLLHANVYRLRDVPQVKEVIDATLETIKASQTFSRHIKVKG